MDNRAVQTEPLVVGADGSEAGFGAIEVASQLAALAGCSLTVVFVCEPPHLVSPATSLGTCASEAAYRIAQHETAEHCRSYSQLLLEVLGVDWTFEIVEGDAARCLAEAVERKRACALVIGQEVTHRHRKSSTRTRVLDGVEVPVIVVPHGSGPSSAQ
jgi:nucleotide-binding universal stress UspA family protein